MTKWEGDASTSLGMTIKGKFGMTIKGRVVEMIRGKAVPHDDTERD